MNNVFAQLGAAMPRRADQILRIRRQHQAFISMTTFTVWVLVILLFPPHPLLNNVVGHESSFASFDNVFIAPMAL